MQYLRLNNHSRAPVEKEEGAREESKCIAADHGPGSDQQILMRLLTAGGERKLLTPTYAQVCGRTLPVSTSSVSVQCLDEEFSRRDSRLHPKKDLAALV